MFIKTVLQNNFPYNCCLSIPAQLPSYGHTEPASLWEGLSALKLYRTPISTCSVNIECVYSQYAKALDVLNDIIIDNVNKTMFVMNFTMINLLCYLIF